MNVVLSNWLMEIRNESDLDVWYISKESVDASVPEWVEFLQEVSILRKEKWGDELLTYAWHDGQACQLRFASILNRDDELPFGGDMERVSDATEILSSWLSQPAHISWTELEGADASDSEGVEEKSLNKLKVWRL